MEFAVLFLIATAAMVAAWCGARTMALGTLAIGLVASVAILLVHATDVLKL